jgi:hypothetical protein
LKLRDTIYLYFDEYESFDDLHLEKITGKVEDNYNYIFPDGKKITFGALVNKEHKTEIKVDKSFIANNLSEILCLNDIRNIGYVKFINDLINKKVVIFLIDKSDFTRRKIILKKILLMNLPNVNI